MRPRSGATTQIATRVHRRSKVGLIALAALTAVLVSAAVADAAQSPVGLGTASSFAVLAGQTVTNTGPSTINGDLGVSPGTAVTGFPPGTVNGTLHSADAVAMQAQSDLTTAYNDAAGRTPPELVPADLGGETLTAGVYRNATGLGLTGSLTLDAQGNPNAVFIFQAGSTLITASGSHVNLINGAQACNVFWQIGSSATLGTSSTFDGNILALTSISVNNSVTVDGRVLARNGSVTLNNDTITAANCATSGTGGGGSGGGGSGTGSGTGSGSGGTGTGGTGSGGGTSTPGSSTPGTSTPGTATPGTSPPRTAVLSSKPTSVAVSIKKWGVQRCVRRTFRVSVTGLDIRRVGFSVDRRLIVTRRTAPWTAVVPAGNGIRTLTARVTFLDGARAKKLHLRFRSCAAATRHVQTPVPSRPPGPTTPPGFTG
jgi:hypothetical protein